PNGGSPQTTARGLLGPSGVEPSSYRRSTTEVKRDVQMAKPAVGCRVDCGVSGHCQKLFFRGKKPGQSLPRTAPFNPRDVSVPSNSPAKHIDAVCSGTVNLTVGYSTVAGRSSGGPSTHSAHCTNTKYAVPLDRMNTSVPTTSPSLGISLRFE